MDKIFKIRDENNVIRDAKLITVFELENKEYAVYSIKRDEENTNLFVSKINRLDNQITLIDIDNSEEKNKIDTIVKGLIRNSLNKEIKNEN